MATRTARIAADRAILVSRVKDECSDMGISLSELARRANVQKLTVMNAAQPYRDVGSRPLTSGVMLQIATALGKSIGEVFFYVDQDYGK